MAPTRVRSAKEKETNRLTQQRKRDAKREAKMEREELKKRGIVDKAAEEAELEEKAANALRQRKLRAKQVLLEKGTPDDNVEDRKPTAKKAPPATATKKAPPERLNLEAVSTPPRTSKKATIVTEAMMTPPPKKGISKSAFQSASKMLTSAGRTLKTFDKNRRASQKEANANIRASQKEANANIRAANANDKVLLNMTNKHMTKVHSLVDQIGDVYSSSEGSPGTATFGSTLSSPSSGSTLSSPSSGSNLSSPSTASLVSPVVEPKQEDSEDDDGIFDKDDDEDDAFFDAVGFDTPQKAEIVMDDSHVTPKVGEVKANPGMFGAMVEAFTPGFLSAKKTKAVSFVEPAEELVGKTDGELVGKIDGEVVEELVDEVAKELVEAAEKPDAVKPVEATIEDPGGKAKKPSLVARLKSLSPIPRKKHSKTENEQRSRRAAQSLTGQEPVPNTKKKGTTKGETKASKGKATKAAGEPVHGYSTRSSRRVPRNIS